MGRLPEGDVTFLFTDIEGSTRLLELHGDIMGAALARHHELLDGIVSAHDGVVFETIGDAVYAAFERPADAIAAALASQRALAVEDWGPIDRLAVRMALHTGPVVRRGDHYFGPPLFRAARLLAIGFGEQTLVSGMTAALVGDDLPAGTALLSLGSHRLKDLGQPEHVFQLVHPKLRSRFPPPRSIDARPHNLPPQLSSFVGRERELAEVAELLGDHRLVTLVGEGGIGKTRLALQTAADRLDGFAGGVFFVDLAVLDDPELVPGAIAGTLGLREQPGQPVSVTLRDHLRDRSVLLVLDNLEQLLPAAAASVAELLGGCPQLRMIATSRAPLRVRGERQYRVSPLGTGSRDTVDNVVPPAVALFVDRARSIDPAFELDTASGPVIAEICDRLDGLPLAIELAVQRLRVFGLTELRDRLSRGLDVLGRGPIDAPSRQQTLRAAIAWSVDLLEASDQELFRRLAVFVAPFTYDAAAGVAAAPSPGDLDANLESLVDGSLVRRVEASGQARYAMLDTVREYGAELLGSSGDLEDTVDRSIRFWAGGMRTFLDAIMSPRLAGGRRRTGTDDAMARMVLDMPNVRNALMAAIARRRQEDALRIIAGVSIVWIDRGPWREALELGEAAFALEELPVSQLASDALHRTAIIAERLGDARRARELWTRALEMRRATGDLDSIESTLTNLTSVAKTPVEAMGYIEECLAIKRRLGTELHDSLAQLAGVRLELDDPDGARPILEEALGEARGVGDHGMAAMIEYVLGRVAHHLGDRGEARLRFTSAVDEADAAGHSFEAAAGIAAIAECDLADGRVDDAGARIADAIGKVPEDEWELHPEHLADVLLSTAVLALHGGDPIMAAEMCGALTKSRAKFAGGLQLPFRQRDLNALASAALDVADAASFWAAWHRGRAIDPDGQPVLARRALMRLQSGSPGASGVEVAGYSR